MPINKFIDNLNIKKNLKNSLLSFINNKGFELFLLQITNKDLNNALSIITEKSFIISYDIEFYHNLINDKNKNYSCFHKSNIDSLEYILTIRELGGILFIKNNTNNWFFIGYFLNVFKPYSVINNRLPIFSTLVSSSNIIINKMSLIEHKILFNLISYNNHSLHYIIQNSINDFESIKSFIDLLHQDIDFIKLSKINDSFEFDFLLSENNYYNPKIITQKLKSLNHYLIELNYLLYPELLNKKSFRHKLILELENIYLNDPFIKSKLITDLSDFNLIIDNSCCIGKENKDIQSIYNTNYITNQKIPTNMSFFDIAIYNQISRINYHNAKLQNTYKHVLSQIDNTYLFINTENKITEIINLDKPHNPVNDSFMAFVISLFIIIKLIK